MSSEAGPSGARSPQGSLKIFECHSHFLNFNKEVGKSVAKVSQLSDSIFKRPDN